MDSLVWLGRRDKGLPDHSMHSARLHHLHLPNNTSFLCFTHNSPTPTLTLRHLVNALLASLQAFSCRYLASAMPEMDTMEMPETTVQRAEGTTATQKR